MTVIVNGETRQVRDGETVAAFLSTLNLIPERVAVELNFSILDRSQFGSKRLSEGDRLEIISFVGGGSLPDGDPILERRKGLNRTSDDRLIVGGIEFRSRLIVGTGKYASFAETAKAVEASGADCVTVAVRRVNITDRSQENLLDYLDPKRYKILPNTAGCYTAEDAIRTARLARAAALSDLVKVEVIGDPKTLLPDNEATLEACRVLVREGFVVLPYTSDDPILAKKLEEIGCAAVMPLAAPIGSGLGIRNPYNIRFILEAVSIPVIVDAGVGTASDASRAMELGCDGVLMNSAIAGAREPLMMAEAMKIAVHAGRLAFLAGRIPRKMYASASSPSEGLIE